MVKISFGTLRILSSYHSLMCGTPPGHPAAVPPRDAAPVPRDLLLRPALVDAPPPLHRVARRLLGHWLHHWWVPEVVVYPRRVFEERTASPAFEGKSHPSHQPGLCYCVWGAISGGFAIKQGISKLV